MPLPTGLKPKDLFQLKILFDVQVSPDGQTVLYVLENVNDQEEAFTTIYALDLRSGETKQLTSGKYRDGSPRWSPDGHEIAFTSDRTGKPQLFLLSMTGGEAQQLTDLKQGVGSAPAWSPDGKKITFTAGPDEAPIDPSKPYRVTRHLFRFNSLGLIENAVQDIFIISTSTREITRLTTGPDFKMNPKWSPDGAQILYQNGLKPDSFQYKTTLEIVDLEGTQTPIIDEWGWVSNAEWMPDGESICFVGKEKHVLNGSKYDLWIVDNQGKTDPVCRTESLKVGVGGDIQTDISNLDMLGGRLFIHPNGRNAIIQYQNCGKVSILNVGLTGGEQHNEIIGGERVCWPLGTDFQRIIFAAAAPTDPGELYVADMDGKNERKLTTTNKQVLSTWPKLEYKHMLFPSIDGAEIEGWLVRPGGHHEPLPTLVYIHGGPHYAFGYMYNFDIHMMVSSGYAVLLINHRASTGYGSEFATETNEDWGNLDYQDIMAGVDFAIKKGFADPDRLGCFGLSFGGYMSCWIVGQTDRFKAAVPENPLSNWVSFYGVSNTEGPAFAVEELGGHPYEVPHLYNRCSPITFAHRCKTPTLLIQGEEDHCCPPEQSEQFYTVLKANDCIVEMLRLPGSAHTGSINGTPIVRRAQNEALLDWMNRYVRDI